MNIWGKEEVSYLGGLGSKYVGLEIGKAREAKREELGEYREKEFLCGIDATLASPVHLALYPFLLSDIIDHIRKWKFFS